MLNLIERYSDKISGTLTCYDRIIISGTLSVLSNSKSMTSYLYSHNVRIFDYPKFAAPFRDQIRANAERIAKENGIEIQFIRKASDRKEEIIRKKLEQRGTHPGLVHIISTMEVCPTYKPWHDKITHQTFLKGETSKCSTYYFYFIDECLGLCYVRVPTWLPFRLQIYFNGHNWLAYKLKEAGIDYKTLDNAFIEISDWDKANELSKTLDVKDLHRWLDKFAYKYCPVYKEFEERYRWSVMQCECSTDIVFNKKENLQSIYSKLVETAIHTVKPQKIL